MAATDNEKLGSGMVVRTWTATATPDGAQRYNQYFANTLLPEIRKLAGFAGGYLLSRELEPQTVVELTTHTFWASMDAINAFAGPEVHRSVVEPEAQSCLLHFESTAIHRSLLVDGRK